MHSASKVKETRHTIPACSSLDKLPQHEGGQSKAREARHVSQDTVESNHNIGKLDMLSQHTHHKHAIPAYIVWHSLVYKRLQKP